MDADTLALAALLQKSKNAQSTPSSEMESVKAMLENILAEQRRTNERLDSLQRRIEKDSGDSDALEQLSRNKEAMMATLTSKVGTLDRRIEMTEETLGKMIKTACIMIKGSEDKVVGALGDFKKTIGRENQAVKKTIEEQLKKVEKVVGGLDGRLGGVRDDIISKVAAVKAEVDACSKVARGACPKCFVIKPIKCQDERGGGKRYCGNCEKEACEF